MKLSIILSLLFATVANASEYHVATTGNDANPGSKSKPFKTIQAAANVAQPGDTITVHAGIYRERVNPPRGGESDAKRIVYQAAPGEKVTITGSEIVKGWTKVTNDTWKVALPNSYFGDFNPYQDIIRGDWFNPQGRMHHTGAVYLNGDWLIEAASHLNEVLAPPGTRLLWFGKADGARDSEYLLNLADFAIGEQRIAATAFAGKSGELHASNYQCVGWIRDGSWLKFDKVNFGAGTESIELRAASVTGGGDIEIRLDKADGELLGRCAVEDTGGWGKWKTFTAKIKPISGEKNICLLFHSRKSEGTNTTIWAQFPGVNPNEANVEINVRKTVFTPEKTGINYITVRGFTLRNAATNWAPPTAGQIGLITAYWCKGWIIENNDIAYSKCSGVALGKYSDEFDNKSANSAEGYVKTVERALENGWNKATVGSHIVRNNHISHCEQTGIVGSLGCSFSTVTGNVIHDIYVHRLFTGAEMAGIKFHGAIDTEISRNRIYKAYRGLWMDWMSQGTRITGNLCYENSSEDLYVEVNHGPFLVDNNLFLSPQSLWDMSEGGAYAHNLMTGKIKNWYDMGRFTPFLKAHSTAVAGLSMTKGEDNRFYNNLFFGQGTSDPAPAKDVKPRTAIVGSGLWVYDRREFPLQTDGNAYCNGARPYAAETNCVVQAGDGAQVKLVTEGDQVLLHLTLDGAALKAKTTLVTTERLGKAKVSGCGYENPDGTPLKIEKDYFGKPRNLKNPTPGPFETTESGRLTFKVWPKL